MCLPGESRSEKLATLFTLRQQLNRNTERPNLALSDFVAPVESGKADYVGGFVVTAGPEEDRISERFARATEVLAGAIDIGGDAPETSDVVYERIAP